MARLALTLAILAATAAGAQAQPVRKFDGTWDATLVCHAAVDGNRKVRPYALQMTGVVLDGQFAAVRGKEGTPGWSYLHGGLDNDGNALLRYETILTDPSLSMSDRFKVGDKVTWQATAKFSAASGSGERIDGRKCDLKFARKPAPDAAPARPAPKG